MLRYLVALGKIGVEVILAGEIIRSGYMTVAGKSHLHCEFNRFAVHFWEGARMCQGNGAYLCIGVIPKFRAVATKQFAACLELGMHFQSHHDLIYIGFIHSKKAKISESRRYHAPKSKPPNRRADGGTTCSMYIY